MVKDFHHFKGNELTRSEKVQLQIVELLLHSKLPDTERESSIMWELKHTAGCCQIGRILAQKRNLDVEIAEIICAMHDIWVIVTGKYSEHAKKGAEYAKKMLEKTGDFSKDEIETIAEAIRHHSLHLTDFFSGRGPFARLFAHHVVADG